MDKEMVSLVALQLEDSSLPVQQARLSCNQSIERLEQRIAFYQTQIADWRSLLDRLDAAEARRQEQRPQPVAPPGLRPAGT